MTLNYRPIRTAKPFFADFNRMLDSVDAETGSHRWQPVLEIRKTELGYLLELDVPGIDPANIELSIENRVLTISGARAEATADDGVIRSERRTGEFKRTFNLAEDIDPASVAATSAFGVLSIELQRKESELPRKITIAVE